MIETQARLAVLNASEILETVATNWMHRFPVRYDALTAEVHFENATLILTADSDYLSLAISANTEEAMKIARQAVENHVDRAAGGATLKFYWTL